MSDRAATFDLITDFGFAEGDTPDDVTVGCYWAIAVIRLGMPLSFSRSTMTSATKDLTQGALLRADRPLVITDDILMMTVGGSKADHKERLTALLKKTDVVNYLVDILPGDWVLGWMVNNLTDYEALLKKIEAGQACNEFNDGFKFVGRVSSLRNAGIREDGEHTSHFNLVCTGFEELDSNFFYDNSLASKDVLERDIGQWLTRLGIDVQKLFGSDTSTGISLNNINRIIPTLIDLIVGRGPGTKGTEGAITIAAADGKNVAAQPQYTETAPYSYMIPAMVGQLLGKSSADASKHVLSYADILELLQGVQSYSNKSGPKMFVPDLTSDSTPSRRVCPTDLLGTFLPYMPDMANKPLWQVLQQYLNPVVNEMYTCLRVNPEGRVVPTIVLRQIPFTTDAFKQTGSLGPSEAGPLVSQDDSRNVPVTRFLDLPRWGVPPAIIKAWDVGRSDATRINFVHVYGTSSYQQNAISIQEQIVNNPPVMDHLDIMRSGMRPYMATVEAWVNDTVGKAPRAWMNLIADWTIGSQYTLNGSITCYGIQAPICKGDNLEFDGVIYHIEAVNHVAQIDPGSGKRMWRTTLQLVNGMRKEAPGEDRGDTGSFPIYPGFESTDNTGFDPGLSLEQRLTTGGVGYRTRPEDAPSQRDTSAQTQLDPATQSDAAALKQISPPRL
jgi:hypothetical protein